MKVLNRNEVEKALNKAGVAWDMDATIDQAFRFASEHGYYNENFTDDDFYSKIEFECVKKSVDEYDEDGEILQELEPAEYRIKSFYLKKERKIIFKE